MTFRSIFVAVFIGTSLVVGALIINAKRPAVETRQPSPQFVEAAGKCAECHRRETSAVVHQYEHSRHATEGVTCLDCHQQHKGQEPMNHNGFILAQHVTSLNCAACHATEYAQFLRSRHAAPAWAAVNGPNQFTPQQVVFAEKYHPGAVKRPANALALQEGPAATMNGCQTCHAVGKPNADGSIGTCTDCHSRHSSSVALARLPETCGQCHLGPDHSQIEIYHESKHGAFMGGADFVQWHGQFELLAKLREIKKMAADLRKEKSHVSAQ